MHRMNGVKDDGLSSPLVRVSCIVRTPAQIECGADFSKAFSKVAWFAWEGLLPEIVRSTKQNIINRGRQSEKIPVRSLQKHKPMKIGQNISDWQWPPQMVFGEIEYWKFMCSAFGMSFICWIWLGANGKIISQCICSARPSHLNNSHNPSISFHQQRKRERTGWKESINRSLPNQISNQNKFSWMVDARIEFARKEKKTKKRRKKTNAKDEESSINSKAFFGLILGAKLKGIGSLSLSLSRSQSEI